MTTDFHMRRLQAAAAAIGLLADTGTDQERQIDVFGLCERLGLWLAFFSLDDLLGAFIPEGSGGILVTTERPVTMQRYTVAHELGHWRLGHTEGPALDSEEQVHGETTNETELLAQIFASALLMPPPLIFGVLRRLEVRSELLPIHAYTVAREAGVSYEAAVRQLANLEIIVPSQIPELLDTAPLRIKTEIGNGQRPIVGTADVWHVDEQWDGHRVSVRVDDEVIIALPENRSTGYRWEFEGHEVFREEQPPPLALTPDSATAASELLAGREALVQSIGAGERHPEAPPRWDAAEPVHAVQPALVHPDVELDEGVTVVNDTYVSTRAPDLHAEDARRSRKEQLKAASGDQAAELTSPASPTIGATGRRVLRVRFQRPGSIPLRLKYRSSYNDAAPHERYVLSAEVEPRRREFSIEQLVTAEDEAWANDVRQRQDLYTTADLRPRAV
ncbi:MAG: ImmA/IrrE family metallo-endopeptidase [bacterium]|nr:ImmA/IrrE family metallo-endopeptidase [bacterium]